MTFGSVFAGIGGFDLGLERAGMTCRWQVENDAYCNRVLAKHWPDVKRYEDVCDVNGEDLEWVDLICGGFPCQDISNAGKREGIDGARSGLWSEMCRLVREVRPRYVLVENVYALLGRGMGRVLGDLAVCGYDAEWNCVSAAAVGAPHLRKRVFIVAHANGECCYSGSQPAGRQARPNAPGGGARAEVGLLADTTGPGQPNTQGQCATARPSRWPQPRASDWWNVEPDVGRVADGVPHRVDRLRSLGNAVVPHVAEYIGRMIVEAMVSDQ